MAVLTLLLVLRGSLPGISEVYAGSCAYREAMMALEKGNAVRGLALMRMASRDGDHRAERYLREQDDGSGSLFLLRLSGVNPGGYFSSLIFITDPIVAPVPRPVGRGFPALEWQGGDTFKPAAVFPFFDELSGIAVAIVGRTLQPHQPLSLLVTVSLNKVQA